MLRLADDKAFLIAMAFLLLPAVAWCCVEKENE